MIFHARLSALLLFVGVNVCVSDGCLVAVTAVDSKFYCHYCH